MGKIIAAAFAAVLGIAIFFDGWYTVDQGYVGVVTTYGAVSGRAEPGFGMKVPFVSRVHDMSIQTQKGNV